MTNINLDKLPIFYFWFWGWQCCFFISLLKGIPYVFENDIEIFIMFVYRVIWLKVDD